MIIFSYEPISKRLFAGRGGGGGQDSLYRYLSFIGPKSMK